MSTRLTPRKYYPPSTVEVVASNKPLTSYDLNPKPQFNPEMPGIEGIGIQTGRWKQELALLVQLAPRNPFADNVRGFVGKHGSWNSTFNYWEAPILSQHKGDALNEVWRWVEDAFFEIDWSSPTIELHWNYALSEKALRLLKHKVTQLNSFWELGEIDYLETSVSLVYTALRREQIEQDALETQRALLPGSQWVPQSKRSKNRLCVNYLRHRQSCYHLLLKQEVPYLKAFRDINQAIAQAYPWLSEECSRQIGSKQKETVYG